MKIHHKKMLLLAFLCWKAFAADSVSVGVTGNIVASPCIFNGGNSNLDVNLGDIQAKNMVTPGSSSDPVAFNLRFTNCPAGTRNVTASFSGIPDPVAGPGYYMNSGTASNVAVTMSEAGSGALKGTGSSIMGNIAADGTATLAMQASVKSMSGGATPGSVSAVVVMTLQYN